MKAEARSQKAERRQKRSRLSALCLLPFLVIACRTIGVTRERGGYALVEPEVAHVMLLDNRQIVVFDFRPGSEYWGPHGHIAGALSVPLDSIELRLPELLRYQDSTVLVYGEENDEGIRGARILAAAGFRNVVLINGGITRWLEGGYKTVTSPSP